MFAPTDVNVWPLEGAVSDGAPGLVGTQGGAVGCEVVGVGRMLKVRPGLVVVCRYALAAVMVQVYKPTPSDWMFCTQTTPGEPFASPGQAQHLTLVNSEPSFSVLNAVPLRVKTME